jgi:hypothetical protein
LLGRLFSPGGVLLVAAAGGVANLIRQLQDELRAGSDDDDEADTRRSSPRANLNLETTEHPTFVLNAEGKVVLWNSKAAAITGACVRPAPRGVSPGWATVRPPFLRLSVRHRQRAQGQAVRSCHASSVVGWRVGNNRVDFGRGCSRESAGGMTQNTTQTLAVTHVGR